ncbi:MAG: nitrite reductase large subunit NirB [Rhodospirillales bacterium]
MLPATRERLVVIGNGMAGMRTVEELLKLDPARYDITVFGAEPHPNYDRIMLSSVLAGEKQVDDIVINPRAWYDDNDIALYAGDPAIAIDPKARTVTAQSGLTVPYDRLLLATGSRPIVPPIPGLNLPGVCAFRDIADVDTMIAAAGTYRKAVVIGGGLLGLEAAWGLKRRGMDVAVVHLMPTLMERQLDETAGKLLQRDLTERGINFFTDGQTEEVTGRERVTGIKLADGRGAPADLVVVAIGIRPDIALAKTAGLEVNRGIVVGDNMATSDPDIFAVGECAEHRGAVVGLVAPIWDMARVCAHHLAGGDELIYAAQATATRLKITGIDVYSAGQLVAGEDEDEVILRDARRSAYRKLVMRDGKVVGTVLYGDVTDGAWYFDLIRRKTDVSDIADRMILGQSATVAGGIAAGPDVASMPDDMQICGCNGVCKGTIVDTIQAKGLDNYEAVKAHTKASASCGSCAPLVRQLLAATLGIEVSGPTIPTVCKCTDHSHEDVRAQILKQKLKTQDAVRKAMAWKTADGCASCRPALNYYLLCAWPGEYADDSRSRFINERAHANIQKDGTYSVIPRMWGGTATPGEIAAIAKVAQKYDIKEIKITGGQRLGIYGVKKPDLPAVWGELTEAGLVSGHAYAKGLRTVKTCVGLEWCRFGTQDSTALGKQLERLTWGNWTPHKFKMGVSGCPRNCAEASIKDFGVVCVESGFDLLVGGNGGIELRGTDRLCHVATEAEVLEYCAAFMQLYREEARYLDRTAPWIERVGIAYVRARVVDDGAGRQALAEKFRHAQSFLQDDPWAERATGQVDATEFEPLTALV